MAIRDLSLKTSKELEGGIPLVMQSNRKAHINGAISMKSTRKQARKDHITWHARIVFGSVFAFFVTSLNTVSKT
jgi:hypothetical protein